MMQHGMMNIETGAVFSGSRKDVEGEDQEIQFAVAFGREFGSTPEVVLGISGLNVGFDWEAYRMRCSVKPRNITGKGFDILLSVPAKSNVILSLQVSWMAFAD